MTKHIEAMKLLQRHFDIALETPDGIKKLRELILTLAMQGKLVPQDPKDQPASELLKEIEAEKKRLFKEGKIKKQEPLPPIKTEEMPYVVPKGWEWVRLNDVLDVRDGTHDTPKYVDVGFPLITSKNLYTGKLSFEDVKFISADDHKKISERSSVDVGDILFAMIGSIGNPVIVDCLDEFSIKNVALFKFCIADKPDNRYLHYFLSLGQENMKATSSGAVQSFVSLGFLRNYLFPLPPLAEQKRIVAKIDQLMALCDKLEAQRSERNQKRITVHTAAMNRLATAPDKTGFDKSWHFITKHFGELYSVPQNMAELKKAILQLAVMGKLAPQDSKDQPASELLKEIEAEKMRLVKEGKIKKQEPLAPIKPEEIPYVVPEGWEWLRLGALIDLISGQHLKPEEYNELNSGISYYTGPADFGPMNPIPSRWTLIERAIAVEGDILLTVKGAGVGKTNVLLEKKAAISRQLMALRAIIIDKDYLLLFLKAIFLDLQGLSVGIAIPGIGRNDVLHRVIPLPPLAEQKRIVAKIDQLMALCDTLNKQIGSATEKQTAILNAVLAKV